MDEAVAPLSPPGESERLRAEIARFLREDRLQPKLDKLKDGEPDARQALIAAHHPAAWVADAAKRVGQIQQVTHAVKFTHPSADGSNLSSSGNPAAGPLELGSHSLAEELAADVVGNAAALDVYKLLRLKVDGRSLLERAVACDPALIEALGEDQEAAAGWVEAFAQLPEAKGRPSTHKLAKQLYWPLEEGGYHLLAPLLSSSVAHALYRRVNADRFGEAAKAAREARRAGKPHPEGYRDYPDLAIQSFGGSKPQNISQLNSERRGENYLLASLPPLWESPALRPPLKTDSVFLRYFGRRREVRRLAGVLKDFLRSVAKRRSNMHIRYTRAELVSELADEVLNMAAELRQFMAPGWTAQPDCQLKLAEQCWLDPARCESDEAFTTRYRRGEWKDDVCRGFANWLNASLQTDKTLFGEAEALEWRTVLQRELDLLREGLGDD